MPPERRRGARVSQGDLAATIKKLEVKSIYSGNMARDPQNAPESVFTQVLSIFGMDEKVNWATRPAPLSE